ncbi:MAG TPA: Ig-like domain-containing protein, partial [Jatrophihabitantaceae bacterium]|nr:Ig-like domain-containing protein [Jatrophihabitantaceae bacterium]
MTDDGRPHAVSLQVDWEGDELVGGAGNNTILARDGAADTIACGDGTDAVSADGVDRVADDCETVGDVAHPPPPPPNDDFDNAVPLSRAAWSFSGSTVAATMQLGEPNHAGFASGHSVWFRWTAPRDGRARVSVFTGTTWDSLLGVYTGASVGALTQVAANDNAPYGSQVSFTATAGTLYWIAVDGKSGATGTFSIQTQLVDSAVPNDDFENAQVLSGSSGSVTGTLAGATTEPGEPNVNVASIWYRFTAPQDGALTLDLAGSAYNMPLQVYSGSSVGTLTRVPIDQSTYQRTVGLTAGVTYSIQVSDDSYGGVGRVALGWTFGLPVNDEFAKARWINNWSDSTYDTTSGATKEAGEPSHAGQPGGHSIWFRLTAYTSQPIELHTSGSTFDTVLAVYTGATVAALTLVAENDDIWSSDTYSFVRFTPVPGRVYSIAVDGKAGATGWVYLHMYPGSGDRGYDFFSEAGQLSGVNGSIPASNVRAGKERREPDHAGERGGASVWWKWTPPANGTATIDTTGSAIDTVLAVYTGDRVEALTPVAANDDDGARVTSKVSFAASVGTTYRIAVDGKYNGLDVAEGAITLNWSLPAEKNPPAVSLTAPAAGSTVGGQTTISASASDDTGVTKVEFLINGDVWFVDSTAPYAVTWDTEEFTNGPYTLAAKAYDVVGNIGTSASRIVTVSTAPNTILSQGPSQYTTSANASFSFYASRSGASFACSLDGAAFAACTMGAVYTGLAEGAHTFRVRASDAGGTDPTPAAWMWTV